MRTNQSIVLFSGLAIGTLGGLIGLGGAEFRLPLLIGLFGFAALEAVIVNKATSLIVVASALPFRSAIIPFEALAEQSDIILNLLAGSLAGAWFGAGWALRLKTATFYKIIAALLLVIAMLLLLSHPVTHAESPLLTGLPRIMAGAIAGFAIGIIASLLGVAGGEFLIPTLILLFGVDVKLAGSLSLAISLPTMITGFARYSADRSFAVLSRNKRFVATLAVGSLFGTFLGGQLLGIISNSLLLPLLAMILVISAGKIRRHA